MDSDDPGNYRPGSSREVEVYRWWLTTASVYETMFRCKCCSGDKQVRSLLPPMTPKSEASKMWSETQADGVDILWPPRSPVVAR